MRTFFLLSITFLFILFAISCKKDSKESPSVNDNKITLSNSSSAMTEDFDQLLNSQGTDAITNLMNMTSISDPFKGGKKKSGQNPNGTLKNCFASCIKQVSPKLYEKYGFHDVSNDAFVFAENTGTYTFSDIDSTWVKTETPTDKIVLVYNYKDEGTNHTARATLEALEFRVFTNENNDSTEMPTKAKGSVSVDEVDYVRIDYTGSFDDNQEPVNISGNLYLKPFEMHMGYVKSSMKIEADAYMKEDGASSSVMSMDLTADLEYTTLDSVPKKVYGNVQYGGLKVVGSVMMKDLSKLNDPKAADIDPFIDAKLYNYPDLYQIGEIVPMDTTDAQGAYVDAKIIFTDGSSEPAEKYFKTIEEDMEKFVDENFGKEDEAKGKK